MKEPRILVITLYSGENEFEQCVASLKAQSYTNWEHQVYEGLSQKEAHDSLKRQIMERSEQFDIFLKLDADMVFKDTDGLQKTVDLFDADPEMDMLEMVVHDWYSDSLIMGMHVYSNRVRWEFNRENLFMDYDPRFPGTKLLLYANPAPIVDHCPDPSSYQAFHFGVHRALKVIQPGRRYFNPFSVVVQRKILRKTWEHFKRNMDRRLGLAVLGANYVLEGKVRQTGERSLGDFASRDITDLFERCSELTSEQLFEKLRLGWDVAVLREFRFLYKVAPRSIPALFYHLMHKYFGLKRIRCGCCITQKAS